MRFRPKLSPDDEVWVEPSRYVPLRAVFIGASGSHLLPAEARRVAAALVREADKIEKKARKK